MSKLDKPQSKFSAFDRCWMLNLFGTAVGAGILFLPIKAGAGGFWPLVAIAIIVGPMVYLAHMGLSRFVLSSKNPGADITEVVEEHFGKIGGWLISALYFLAIYPILMIYGVGITNTVQSYITNQLQLAEPARWLVSGLLIAAFILIICVGEKFVLIFNEKLVYPLCAVLFGMSVYLIPNWQFGIVSVAPTASGMVSTIWLTLPVLVFAFNHSPAISSFSVAQVEEYGENAEVYGRRTLKATAGILMLFVMFFVFSCVLTLSPEQLMEAKAQNIPILSYLANTFENPVISHLGPLVAFLAITTSFFGHYLGAREGLMGLINKTARSTNMKLNEKAVSYAVIAFFFVTIWVVAVINPGILDTIDAISGPVIACILFVMPVVACFKVESLKKYRTHVSIYFVLIAGLMAITSNVLGAIAG